MVHRGDYILTKSEAVLRAPEPTRRELLRILSIGASATASAAQRFEFPKRAIIRTILKDLSPNALGGGATLFHEHLSLAPDFMPRWIAAAGLTGRGPAPPPTAQPYFMQDLDLMVEEMTAAARAGVACIVDGGHEDMGRDLDFLRRLSLKSGMPVVASCGYYAQPFYPPKIATMSEDEIFADLIHTATTQRVGALGEIGTWDVMTPDERKVFRAVGRAHVATNLPIFTHTAYGKGAMEQLDLLESVGVKPQHVAIGHVGGLADPKAEAVKDLCKRGAFVGYDRQGGAGDARNVAQVVALIEAGYTANLLLASDFSSGAQLVRNHGPGYAKTVTVFVPKLREAGVKEDTLHEILVDNPRRFLAFVPEKRER
jgi:phosphotriesterase-related protein